MKPLLHGWRYAAVCSVLAALPIAAACTQPAAATSAGDLTDGELAIEFSTMYSAFIPSHETKIPAKVDGVKNIKWSADPADAVEFQKGDTSSDVLIVIKSGDTKQVTITAKAGSLKATAPLTISSFGDDVYDEGSQRYNNGVVFTWGGDHDGGGGGGHGGGGGDGGMRQHTIDPHLACTNCHNKGGTEGGDVEHTPMQTGGYSDQDLINIFTNATKPDGIEQRIMPLAQWQKIHKWQMDEQQQNGLIAYLRALEPKSQGPVDFPGQHMGGGKGGKGGPGGGQGGSTTKPTTPTN